MGLIFSESSLYSMKYLKPFLPKATLLDTTILHHVYIMYRNKVYVLVKFAFFNSVLS